MKQLYNHGTAEIAVPLSMSLSEIEHDLNGSELLCDKLRSVFEDLSRQPHLALKIIISIAEEVKA